MNPVQAILLGLVEGLTEFLPVSSTAHLLVVQRLFGLTSPSPFFDVVVQLGALFAVIVYFWRRLLLVMKDTSAYVGDIAHKKKTVSFNHLPDGVTILIASLPILIVGFLLRHKVEALHDSLYLIAATSIIFGIFLWIAESQKHKKETTTKNVIVMGIYQVLAVLPGTSRSGITIAGGLMEGMEFARALEYSFLLSIPALGVAGLYELYAAIKMHPSSDLLLFTLLGTVTAFVSAFIVIKTFLQWVRSHGFTPFVIYRFVFGALVLWLALSGK
ncbi:undecaprenyl-diphosphatase [Candidatus Cerribacteria bacterium 'Amazon FNV 2010 28 9']|uniref:Undecaprenyl-diphosphatase n=1 Tax=Candidatus Cerribacteria bacterium 'Amazon FNV 2010 28 9' TaxID=2081795 RepID=A0A317JLV4_9BACT|nr:MAG: undecaprenyl-diphosphatase [Candidatus Cerribacteria bacterium 'Amazon FNV 2010 28 9']